MPNYRDYQKSVAVEFNAYKDRVRNIIDDKHWGLEGRHKEVILMNYLKRVLPKHLSVGTGFVGCINRRPMVYPQPKQDKFYPVKPHIKNR